MSNQIVPLIEMRKTGKRRFRQENQEFGFKQDIFKMTIRQSSEMLNSYFIVVWSSGEKSRLEMKCV